jgi:hypothetical protein
VILALKGTEPVVADSYQEALKALFGQLTPASPTSPVAIPTNSQTAATGSQEQKDAAAALQIMDDAEKALKAGDFATYGTKLKALKAKLEAIAGAK